MIKDFSFVILLWPIKINDLGEINQKLNIASFPCTILYLTRNLVLNTNNIQVTSIYFQHERLKVSFGKRAELSVAVQMCLGIYSSLLQMSRDRTLWKECQMGLNLLPFSVRILEGKIILYSLLSIGK